MKSKTFIPVVQGAAVPDPIAAPGSVLESMLFTCRRTNHVLSGGFSLFAWFVGTAAETITGDLYALVEPAPSVLANRRYVLLATGVVITANISREVPNLPKTVERLYFRRTADAITAAQTRQLNLSV